MNVDFDKVLVDFKGESIAEKDPEGELKDISLGEAAYVALTSALKDDEASKISQMLYKDS